MSAGILNQISFVKEVAWGTPGTPDKSIPVHFTGGMRVNQNPQFLSAVKATRAKNQGEFVGAKTYEGSYEFDLAPDHVGHFLLGSMGAVNTALKGGETIVYDHTFTESTTTPVSYTIEEKVGENIIRYAGCSVKSIKISAKAGEAVTASVEIMAKSVAGASAIAAAYTNIAPFNFKDAVFKIGGSTIAETSGFDFEYKNNMEYGHALGSYNPAYRELKPSEVNVKFDSYLDSTTLAEMTAYIANTPRALVIELTGAAIGSASNYKLVITIPVVYWTTAQTPITDGFNILSAEGQAVYDTGTSKLFNAVLTNLTAAY